MQILKKLVNKIPSILKPSAIRIRAHTSLTEFHIQTNFETSPWLFSSDVTTITSLIGWLYPTLGYANGDWFNESELITSQNNAHFSIQSLWLCLRYVYVMVLKWNCRVSKRSENVHFSVTYFSYIFCSILWRKPKSDV